MGDVKYPTPYWVEAALSIEGVSMGEEAPLDGPCRACGRDAEGCTHPEIEERENGSTACYECWTITHGTLEEGEEWLCKVCCHFDYPLVHRLPREKSHNDAPSLDADDL